MSAFFTALTRHSQDPWTKTLLAQQAHSLLDWSAFTVRRAVPLRWRRPTWFANRRLLSHHLAASLDMIRQRPERDSYLEWYSVMPAKKLAMPKTLWPLSASVGMNGHNGPAISLLLYHLHDDANDGLRVFSSAYADRDAAVIAKFHFILSDLSMSGTIV